MIHYHGQSERRTTTTKGWRKMIHAEYLFYRKHYQPDTIARIFRWERIKATWRLPTLQLGPPFMKDSLAAQEKIVKFSVLKDELRSVK